MQTADAEILGLEVPVKLTLLIVVLSSLMPSWASAESRTYDFIGYTASRTYFDETKGDGGVPHAGQPFTGFITVDTDNASDSDPDIAAASFRGVIRTIELQFVNLTSRLRYSRRYNGDSELLIRKGGPDDAEEIRLTALDVIHEGGVGRLKIVLVGRAAHRNLLASTSPDVPLTAIPAPLWDLQITSPASATGHEPMLGIGRLTAIRLRASGEGGFDTYYGSDFPWVPPPGVHNVGGPPPGTGWTHPTGAWEVRTGTCCAPLNQYFANTQAEPFSLALFINTFQRLRPDGEIEDHWSLVRTDYSFAGHLKSTWKAPGNTLGVVYNYADAQNHAELRLAPTGLATITEVIRGERRVVATSGFPRAEEPRHCWKSRVHEQATSEKGTSHRDARSRKCLMSVDASFRIIRTGLKTTVWINDRVVFNRLHQPQLGNGQLGVFSSWNMIQFRQFSARVHVPRFFPPERAECCFVGNAYFVFPFDLLLWTERRGTWSIDRETLSYANLPPEPFSLTTFSYDDPPIAADYTVDVNVFANIAGGPASGAGIVYEFVSPDEYYDLLLLDEGKAVINKVIAGVRTEVATSTWQGHLARWLQVGVIRRDGGTSIEVEGERIFSELPQATRARHDIGLMSHFSTTRFNHVFIYWEP